MKFTTPCPRCHGSPFAWRDGRMTTCARCSGTGRVVTDKCPSGCASGWVGAVERCDEKPVAIYFGRCATCGGGA